MFLSPLVSSAGEGSVEGSRGRSESASTDTGRGAAVDRGETLRGPRQGHRSRVKKGRELKEETRGSPLGVRDGILSYKPSDSGSHKLRHLHYFLE